MSDDEIDLEAMVERQLQLHKLLQKTLINYKKDSASKKNAIYFERRLQKLNDLQTEFRANDRFLILNRLSSDSDYIVQEVCEAFEEQLLDCICTIEGERNQKFPVANAETTSKDFNTKQSQNNPDHNKNPPSRLQKIQVPVFDGKYTDWPHFRDMYSSLVHANNQLSKVEKFWYLKDSLRGEPYDMLKYLVTTDENYAAAWKMLADHYENPRELFKSQMHIFSAQPKLKEEKASDIRTLLSVSRECRQALTTFDIDVKHCDPLLVYFITQKLPTETVGLWEMKVGGNNALPTFEELQTFLDIRIKTLDAITESRACFSTPTNISHTSSASSSARSSRSKSSKSKKSFHVTTNNKGKRSSNLPCVICQEMHILRKCPRFLAMSTVERRKSIEGKNLCENCLGNDHGAQNCFSKYNCR